MQFFTEASTETTSALPFDPLTIFLVLMLVVLVIFMVRNSRKRKAQMAELELKMVPGARVMTNFGLYGELVSNDSDNEYAEIEVAPGVVIDVHRTTLSRVIAEEPVDEADPEPDTDTQQGDGPIERL